MDIGDRIWLLRYSSTGRVEYRRCKVLDVRMDGHEIEVMRRGKQLVVYTNQPTVFVSPEELVEHLEEHIGQCYKLINDLTTREIEKGNNAKSSESRDEETGSRQEIAGQSREENTNRGPY